MRPRIGALAVLLALLALGAATTAKADGEVGLVIEENGQVRTYCLAYGGESVGADDLLKAAGVDYEDLGTGSGSVLCSIEDTGCFDASSYDTCWCHCKSGGSDCVYWSFFTRDYGSGWVYSARAFDRVNANDGDVQAWRWGQAAANSAPKPSDSLTFESVCGHAPRGGAPPPQQASPTLAATQPPPAGSQATQAPGTSAPGTASSTVETPVTLEPATSQASPSVSVTFTSDADGVASSRGVDKGDGGGGSALTLVAFAIVAVVLLGAIGAAAIWRRGDGS